MYKQDEQGKHVYLNLLCFIFYSLVFTRSCPIMIHICSISHTNLPQHLEMFKAISQIRIAWKMQTLAKLLPLLCIHPPPPPSSVPSSQGADVTSVKCQQHNSELIWHATNNNLDRYNFLCSLNFINGVRRYDTVWTIWPVFSDWSGH